MQKKQPLYFSTMWKPSSAPASTRIWGEGGAQTGGGAVIVYGTRRVSDD